MSPVVRSIAFVLIALLAACGGGGDPPPASSRLAVDALAATAPVVADAADAAGELLLTRLSVTLAAGATVEQLDAAMAAVGATGVAYSSPGSPTLTLAVPRQANGAALVALAQRLRTMPGIGSAAPGRQMASLLLPGQDSGSPQSPDLLQHLLPSRFPAAWNAAFDEQGQLSHGGRCRAIETTVIVADTFQSWPADPANQLDLFEYAEKFGVFPQGPDDHGWQVAATLASPFDALLPTGATALVECHHFVLVDISLLTYEQIVAQLKQAILAQPAGARMIANLSFGFGKKFCGPGVDQVCTAENAAATPPGVLQWEIERRVLAAIEWAAFTDPALEERMLLVQAAGNEKTESADNGGMGVRYAGMRQARLISPFALATQLGALEALYSPQSEQAVGLWTSGQQPSLLLDGANVEFLRQTAAGRASRIPATGNLLLVGSATLPDSYWHGDIAESAFSNEGAMLLAVGERVVGLDGVWRNGTSFAAPQVAGLATHLWTISELRTRPARETAAHIKATATSKSLLDAYAATLALDTLPSIGTPRIREALLDVDGDGQFDERDLQRFVDVYGLGEPNPPAGTRDYGRFDLNGDGATGGINAMAFDLDRGSVAPGDAPQYGAVDRAIEGYPVTFNEPVLSDLQVLCFYAYSPLFAGGAPTPAQEAFRTSVLGPDRCVGVRIHTLFAAQVTGSAPLEVTLEVPAGNGQYAPAPDLHVAFTPSCGSVSPASGRTDAAGRVSATVTPTGCTGSVSVTAVASANPGTPPLARKVVTATVSVGSSLQTLTIDVGGYTPGYITFYLYGSEESIAPIPIGQAASVAAVVDAALAGTSWLSTGLHVRVSEPVVLSLNLAIPVGEVSVIGQTPAACGSNISLSVGDVRKQDTSRGTVGIGGCLGRVTLATGDVGDSIAIAGTDTEISVTSGKVARVVNIGNWCYFSTVTSGLAATIRTSATGYLQVCGVRDSRVDVQGGIEHQPGQITAGLNIRNNTNLTLGPVTGGDLNHFEIESSTFAGAPSISVGNLVHPGGDVVSPNGSVRIVGNNGLSIGAISMGNVAGDLRIQDNRGFSNADASAFATARAVGGATIIGGNSP